jgi:hypothetical protein
LNKRINGFYFLDFIFTLGSSLILIIELDFTIFEEITFNVSQAMICSSSAGITYAFILDHGLVINFSFSSDLFFFSSKEVPNRDNFSKINFLTISAFCHTPPVNHIQSNHQSRTT